MTLLTEEKFVEFCKSGKLCEIFGHTMEDYGKGGTSKNLDITLGSQTIHLDQFIIETNSQRCKFCRRHVIYTKDSQSWRTQDEGGLKTWEENPY